MARMHYGMANITPMPELYFKLLSLNVSGKNNSEKQNAIFSG